MGSRELLATERDLHCVFCSEHAASDLKELSERARQARDLPEFTTRFVDAKWIENVWQQLRTRWDADESETWERLRRITVHGLCRRRPSRAGAPERDDRALRAAMVDVVIEDARGHTMSGSAADFTLLVC